MEILIIGSESKIARGLIEKCSQLGFVCWVTTRKKNMTGKKSLFLDLSLDVNNFEIPKQIKVAVICAGVTSIKKCEEDPELSRRINVLNTFEIAKRLVGSGVFVVFISSNAVFDGRSPFSRVTDPACPTTEYGRQKAEVEKKLTQFFGCVGIVRFSKIIVSDMPLFRTWIQDLQADRLIYPFSDKLFSPITLGAAVDKINFVLMNKISGITQLSGDVDISYWEAACFIASQLGLRKELIRPIFANDPRYTTLDCYRPPSSYESVSSSCHG